MPYCVYTNSGRADRGVLTQCFALSPVILHAYGILRPLQSQQAPAQHEQIGQGTSNKQPMGVLGNPAVAHFNETKHPLNHSDRVLAFGPHLGLIAVLRSLSCRERLVAARFLLREVARFRSNCPDRLGLPRVAESPHTRVSFPCSSAG
jgi:hypothetical protein